jgi:hypothetical protein
MQYNTGVRQQCASFPLKFPFFYSNTSSVQLYKNYTGMPSSLRRSAAVQPDYGDTVAVGLLNGVFAALQ